ncbi:MAG: arginine repressor [Lachnospiraceae bacterium]
MKIARHKKILELINKYEISTQEELAERLIDSGFLVTQATVSRDIRELSLTKVNSGMGQRYAAVKTAERDLNKKLLKILKEGYLSSDLAGSIVVIKTEAGMAMAVAAALDAIVWNEVAGTIAGDDTIFCAVRSSEEGMSLMMKLSRLSSDDKKEQ